MTNHQATLHPRADRAIRHALIQGALVVVLMTAGTAAYAAERISLEGLAARAETLRSSIEELRLEHLPTGAIVMWSGGLASLPQGWVLCDGGNGTPDLRARFVRGASPVGSDAGPALAPHALGGSTAHSHPPYIHRHEFGHDHGLDGVTAITAGSHSHFSLQPVGSGQGLDPSSPLVIGNLWSYTLHPHETDVAAGHTHGLRDLAGGVDPRVDWRQAFTTNDAMEVEPAEHVPPFYAVAFIMKVAGGE